MQSRPFGPTLEHRQFGSGFVDIPRALHQALLAAIFHSLLAQGFQRMVLWRGCGGHDVGEVVDRFNHLHQGQAHVFLPPHPFHEIWCRLADSSVPAGHADSFTTSISLYLRPASVRQDQIWDPHSEAVDWDDPQLDFARYSSTGVIGDPTHASAALGKRLWEAVVEEAASTLKRVATVEL